MIKPYPVRVTEEIKTGRSSEAVIASVLRGEPLPKGDIGAFLVGVFACRPLTNDGKSYDPKILKQWHHCRYKTEWQTALRGEDIFTDQQRALKIRRGTSCRPIRVVRPESRSFSG